MEAAEHGMDNAATDLDEATKPELGLSDLHDKLDALWIAYLNHLDAYTAAQELLQRHLKAGHLSLARANFEARNGTRKYGRDYYHERAVATKRITISTQDGQPSYALRLVDWRPPFAEGDEESESPIEVEKTGNGEEDVTQLPSPSRTPEPNATAREDGQPDAHGSEVEATEKLKTAGKAIATLPLPADPLRWLGILVPASLRSAQTSFVAAVDETVAQSVSAARAMRGIEVEIRRVRKEIRRAERESPTGSG